MQVQVRKPFKNLCELCGLSGKKKAQKVTVFSIVSNIYVQAKLITSK